MKVNNELIKSTKVEDIKTAIEGWKQNKKLEEIESYDTLYKFVYKNHTRIKRVNSISIEEKIRSLNLRERLIIRVENGELPFNVLAKFNNLKELDIILEGYGSQYNFQVIKSIFDIVSLRILRIRNYRLRYLPDTIGNLINLEVLDLNSGGIVEMPESFKNIKNLKSLIFHGNPISEIELEKVRTRFPDCEIK